MITTRTPVSKRMFDFGLQCMQQGEIEGVHHLGPVQGDHGHAVFLLG
jgi:hypothetical protein